MVIRPSVLAAILAGGVSVPTLPQVGNIAARFSAAAIPAQANNTSLASWTDSVSGISMTQATGASQPKYVTGGTGGKPAVRFNGTAWLSASMPALKTLIDAGTYSVFIVLANTAASTFGGMLGNSAGGNSFLLYADANAIGRFDGTVTGSSVGGNCLPWASTAPITLGYSSSATQVYPEQTGTSLDRMYLQGLKKVTNAGRGPATSSSDGFFAIGAANSAGQLAFAGDIQEIIIWNTLISDMDYAKAQTFISAYQGLPLPWAGAPALYVYDGDSLTRGVGNSGPQYSYPYLNAQRLGLTYGQYSIQSIGGMTMNGMALKLAEWSGLPAYCGLIPKITAWEWYNEKNYGYTPAQQQTHVTTYCAGARAIPSARLCLGSSTGYSGDPDAANRNVYDAYLDANGATLAQVYIAIHADSRIGTPGAYAANSATYWNADGVHLINAGYTALESILAPGIALL